MKTPLKTIFNSIYAYFFITLGVALFALSWVVFIIPHSLVGGGITGVGALIYYGTGFPISYTYFLVNIVLLAIALKVLGKSFGIKTVYAIFISSFFLEILPNIIPHSFIVELALNNGTLLSALLGGVLSGLGIGITFAHGGSTGGTDIIALIINKYRSISPGKILLFLDVVIIAISMFLPSDLSFGLRLANVMYGYISVAIGSYTIDLLVSGNKQSIQLFVFSPKYKEIADRVNTEMGRGVTVLDGQGWYTKEEKKVLFIITRKEESSLILHIIKEEDKNAFITVGNVMGVYGVGFDKIAKK